MIYEQLSLFDIEKCLLCKNIKLNYYKTEGIDFDFCLVKKQYIDRKLTSKESCSKFEKEVHNESM